MKFSSCSVFYILKLINFILLSIPYPSSRAVSLKQTIMYILLRYRDEHNRIFEIVVIIFTPVFAKKVLTYQPFIFELSKSL